MKLPALVPVIAVILSAGALAAPGSLEQGGSTPASQEQPIFRASVRTVPVYATVLDANGRLVPELGQEDFTILDNGKPSEIALFSA